MLKNTQSNSVFIRRSAVIFAGCLVLAAMTLGDAQGDEDTAALEAAAPKADVGQTGPVNWVPCADEPHNCNFEDPRHLHIVRYGVNGSYFFFAVKGVASVPCTFIVGNPTPPHKRCEYTKSPIFEGLQQDENFGNHMKESQRLRYMLDFDQAALYWIRYGDGERWIYDMVGGRQWFKCNNQARSGDWDPHSGKPKFCQNGPKVKELAGSFTRCAAGENNPCTIGPGPALIRYGLEDGFTDPDQDLTGSEYVTRVVRSKTINCSLDTFRYDPAKGKAKFCDIAPFGAPAASTSTTGYWDRQPLCFGNGCTNHHWEVDYGTSHTDSWSDKKQWGVTVQASIKSDVKVFGSGTEVTGSIAGEFAASSEFTNALGRSVKKVDSQDCFTNGVKDGYAGVAYAFRTQTTLTCLSEGVCEGSTYMPNLICYSYPLASGTPPPPKCLPGYCADPYCQQCSYQ